jgi:hypothetical protein
LGAAEGLVPHFKKGRAKALTCPIMIGCVVINVPQDNDPCPTGHALEQILALRNCKATSLGARVYAQLAQAAHEEAANQIEALVALTISNGDSGMGARAELSAVVRELVVRWSDLNSSWVFLTEMRANFRSFCTVLGVYKPQMRFELVCVGPILNSSIAFNMCVEHRLFGHM